MQSSAILLAFAILYYGYGSLCLYLIARRLDVEHAWFAFFPILDAFLMLSLAGKPWWWIFLLAIPFVDIVITAIAFMEIAKAFGKSSFSGLAIFIPLVNLVFLGQLAFSAHGTAISLLVAVLSLALGVVAVWRQESATPSLAESADSNASQATPAGSPIAPPQDREPHHILQANGCKLSAPETWTVQAQPQDSVAKLVIADPTGKSSVGIHYERAVGKDLTEKDVARLMEEAKRMPFRLEDGSWSRVDDRDAWREVRSGSLRGSNRIWMRYSYQLGSAVVQVIGVAADSPLRVERGLLDTVMKSVHCEQ